MNECSKKSGFTEIIIACETTKQEEPGGSGHRVEQKESITVKVSVQDETDL